MNHLTHKQAFAESAKYFPTPLQAFQYIDKYSKFNYDHMRRETWIETVDRAVNYLRELSEYKLDEDVYADIHAHILTMQAMPSMRLLAMAGEPARRNGLAVYNCFAGEETFVTQDGIKSFQETEGQTVKVRAGDGKWRDAHVLSFGNQPLMRVSMRHWNGGRPGNFTSDVIVTADHRWILRDGTETTSLKVGDKLISGESLLIPCDLDQDAIRHGIIYGDGTLTRQKGVAYAQIRLCGRKAALKEQYFDGFGYSYPPSYNGDPMVYCGRQNAHWKEIPSNTSASYVAGFIHGLFLTDGVTTEVGHRKITTQNEDLALWIIRHASLAGYKVLAHSTYDKPTNFGKRAAPLHHITLGANDAAVYRVESIEFERFDEVFCVVEPVTRSFMLGNGQITGNCSAMGVDSIDAFVEALIISMSGCGVGFSVEDVYVSQLPIVQPQRPAQRVLEHTVEDSAEGWADALRLGLEQWFSGFDVTFDLSLIRPAGAILKTKGGRASGPQPLRELLDFARQTILNAQGRRLMPFEAHDLMCEVGNAAVQGGVRRTAMISLFDHGNYEMNTAKHGDFNPRRWNANNSVVIDKEMTRWEIGNIMRIMHESGRGEPGFFSRIACENTKPARRKSSNWLTNPCAEIILMSNQLCNLSICVARPDDTPETLRKKVEIATIIGTIQSMSTHFPGLRPVWKQNCEDERLLGVDITGQMDCPLLQDAALLRSLRDHAVATNKAYAALLGINQSAAVTCVKPSGNSAALLNCSSGLHARHSPYYIRRVRVGASGALYKVLRDAGVPLSPENGQTAENATTWVASFPIAAPEGTPTKAQRSAIDQLEYWKHVKLNWCEHSPSATIGYDEHELPAMIDWLYDNQAIISGLSFLQNSNAQYEQMPYEEISREQYDAMAAAMPDIDWSLITEYESEDYTEAAATLSCMAGVCELF